MIGKQSVRIVLAVSIIWWRDRFLLMLKYWIPVWLYWKKQHSPGSERTRHYAEMQKDAGRRYMEQSIFMRQD